MTVATHSEGYYDAIQTACKNNHIRFVTLGLGERWKGYAWKFYSMKKFLFDETESAADKNLYVFVDGFDVIPNIHSENVAIERFYEVSGGKMVLGINAKPRSGKPLEIFQSWLDKQIFGLCDGKSLNSGVYCGSRDQIMKFLDLCALEGSGDNDDDQRMLLKACNKHATWFLENVHIDEEGLFMLNVTCAISASSRDRLFNALQRQKAPLFFHGAGGCEMNSIASRLGLPKYRKIFKSNRRIIQRVFGNDGYARYAIRSPRIMSLMSLIVVCFILFTFACVRILRNAFKSRL